jgi:ATP-dependent DNA helicase RecG
MKRAIPFYLTAIKGAKLSDLATDRIAWFVAEASATRKFSFSSAPTPKNVLLELGLLEKNRLLHAALMLFGREPQRTSPAAVVRCSHYHGAEVVRPIPSQHVFGATLFEQIDAATDFVLARLDRTIGDREEANIAVERLEIPKEAIREIIVNSVVHRDYDSKASVQIDVFADRVEVMNPGSLPKELSVEDLPKKHLSVPVNPFLARPFYLAGYINQLGYGTRNVVKWCREVGLPDPDFIPGNNQFRVTIWRNWLTDERLNQLDVNDRQRAGITFLKEHRKISNPVYQKVAKAIKKTATRDLKDLVEKGVLEQRGTRGPGVHYVLATNRDKMGTKGTPAPEAGNRDKMGTKRTSRIK